jgi:hypothetical protein
LKVKVALNPPFPSDLSTPVDASGNALLVSTGPLPGVVLAKPLSNSAKLPFNFDAFPGVGQVAAQTEEVAPASARQKTPAKNFLFMKKSLLKNKRYSRPKPLMDFIGPAMGCLRP